MTDPNQESAWEEIQSIWKDSARHAAIRIEIEALISEFKSKINPYEQRAIASDLAMIRRATSEFEKNSIQRDIERFREPLLKLLRWFRKD
jgi:hypothetical protein